MEIIREKGTTVLNQFGTLVVFNYDAWTSYEGFEFLFGCYEDVPIGMTGQYRMVEVSSNTTAVTKDDCPTAGKRLPEAMCNKFLLRLSWSKRPLKEIIRDACERQQKVMPFELWKTASLIGLGL